MADFNDNLSQQVRNLDLLFSHVVFSFFGKERLIIIGWSNWCSFLANQEALVLYPVI